MNIRCRRHWRRELANSSIAMMLIAIVIAPLEGRLRDAAPTQVASQVRSRLKAEQINAWSNVRVTGGEDPHAYGINVDIWKHGDTLVGYMSEYGGFIADPPIARLDSIRFNEQSGAISFSVRLTAGAVSSATTTAFVPAKWLYEFAGVVGDTTITGSLRKTLLNRDSRANVSSQQVVLKSVEPSTYEAQTHNTLEKWVAWREMLVKLRGSGGE